MKKIIVHGNRHESYPKRFECYRCGCIFETSDHKEYFRSYEMMSNVSKCPECNFTSEEIERDVIFKKGEKLNEETFC